MTPHAAWHALCRSRQYAWVDRYAISASDAAKLFLPPVDEGEHKMQVARPLPADRQAWLDEFERARRAGE